MSGERPPHRYATAQELADELERYLNGDPIRSRPLNRLERLGRWCQRNPRLAILGEALVLLSLVVLVGTPVAIYRIPQERKAALRYAAEESRQRPLTDAALWKNESPRAQELFASDQVAGGLARLASLLRRNRGDWMAAEWLMNELTYRSFGLSAVEPLGHRRQGAGPGHYR